MISHGRVQSIRCLNTIVSIAGGLNDSEMSTHIMHPKMSQVGTRNGGNLASKLAFHAKCGTAMTGIG